MSDNRPVSKDNLKAYHDADRAKKRLKKRAVTIGYKLFAGLCIGHLKGNWDCV